MNEQPGDNAPQNVDGEQNAETVPPASSTPPEYTAPQEYTAPPAPPAPEQPYGSPAAQTPYGSPAPEQPYGSPAPQPAYGSPAQQQPHGAPAPQPAPGGFPPAGYAPAFPAGPPAQQQAGGPVPPSKRRLGTGGIIAIIAGGVALLVAIVLAIVFAVVVPLARGGSDGAQAAVESYFSAIADGDAETVLSYLDEGVASSPLITDEALLASQKVAPISDVVVGKPEVSSMSGIVPVTYTIGGTDVSTEFSVYKYDDDGNWIISGGTSQLSLLHLDGLQPTINGIPVEGEYVDVVPGGYEFGVALPSFAVEGETTVIITEANDYPDLSTMQAVLTDEAKESFRQAVSASINECIAATTLEAGCGLTLPASLSDGTLLVDGTIVRTLSADTRATIDSLEPTLSYSNPTLAEGGYIGGVEVSAECSQNGSSGTCTVLFAPSLGTPSMNFANENPVVEWD